MEANARKLDMQDLTHARDEKVARRPGRTSVVIKPVGHFKTIGEARRAAAACTRCDLYKIGTQTVFGEGPQSAEVMFVGEQPGDREDMAGKPFIGPAGQLLDEMLEETGIDRDRYYVTNAVKHFKHAPRGKRRLHQRPNAGEIERCRWWLHIERDLIKPKMIVALGATAAQAVTGSGAGILKRRGKIETLEDGMNVFVTIHPSAVLRAGDPEARAEARRDFLRDLRALARLLE
jgi:uracil-DNA glycosylase family protein